METAALRVSGGRRLGAEAEGTGERMACGARCQLLVGNTQQLSGRVLAVVLLGVGYLPSLDREDKVVRAQRLNFVWQCS